MMQEIVSSNDVDQHGTPTGGTSSGLGINIRWQNGPLGRGPERKQPNGAFVEGVILAAIQRLEFFQRASGGKFACEENERAIEHLDIALGYLEKRTIRREAAGIEGTHAAQ